MATSQIAKACFVFILFDIFIFQLGLYNKVMSPNSMAGMAYYFVKYEKKRQVNPEKDILILGDSKISEGFSAARARLHSGKIGFNFIQGGIPGTTYRTWYYLLKTVDPSKNRYRAIILTLPSYRKIPYDELIPESRTLDIEILAPILAKNDLIELGTHYPDLLSQLSIWSLSIIKAPLYRSDIQDFLFSPILRKNSIAWRRNEADHYLDSYQGHSESMDGLSINLTTHEISFPKRLTGSEKKSVETRYTMLHKKESDSYEEYSLKWLNKIVRYYDESKTKIIFLRCPTNPIPEQHLYPSGKVSDFLQHAEANIKVIDDDLFKDLEAPSYFFDTFHMNNKGRNIFSDRLTDWLIENI